MSISGGLVNNLKPKKVELSAVVTRADGSVEDRGVIAFYDRNPLKNVAVNIWLPIKRLLKGYK
jgi:hypothetical protein